MKRRALWIHLAGPCAFAVAATASAGLSTRGDSAVTFEAIGPAGMKISGNGNGIGAVEADGKITLSAPTTAFHTGIGLRDKHLRNYLEADKFPSAKLVVEKAKLKLPEADGVTSGTVTAPLTLHGVTKDAQVTYSVTRAGSDLSVKGDLQVNILEFGIKKPCYLGVCVEDNVKIHAEFKAGG